MIYSTLCEREALEQKAILKLVALMFFQNPPMKEGCVAFIDKLGAFSSLSKADIDSSMKIDMREEWKFSELQDVLTLESQKLLFFLMRLAEESFDPRGTFSSLVSNKEVGGFIDKYISPNLIFSDVARAEVSTAAEAFFSASCDAYEMIHEGSLSKKEAADIPLHEKLFIINGLKLGELDSKELSAFLSVFDAYVMQLHNASASGAEAMFLNYVFSAFYEQAKVSEGEVVERAVNAFLQIEEKWVKRLILFSALLRLNDNDKPLEDSGIKKIQHSLGFDPKFIEKSVFPVVMAYKSACVNAFLRMHDDNKNHYSGQKKSSENMRVVLAFADLATDFVPGVAGIKRIHQSIRRTGNLFDSLDLDPARDMEKTFRLCRLVDQGESKVINIVVNGFMTESGKGQFDEWIEPFDVIGLEGGLMGFSWPSRSFGNAHAGSWYDAAYDASVYGGRLAEEINNLKSVREDLVFKLYGHSLGCRVIQHALLDLHESGNKVRDIFLFGGAVSRTEKPKWSRALQSVEGSIYNFYSKNDSILRDLYKAAEFGDDPAGLGDIEYLSNRGAEQGSVINFNVTNIIESHADYKLKLVRLLGNLQH